MSKPLQAVAPESSAALNQKGHAELNSAETARGGAKRLTNGAGQVNETAYEDAQARAESTFRRLQKEAEIRLRLEQFAEELQHARSARQRNRHNKAR